MANKCETEISLMKGVSVKLDQDTVFTLGYFVHTEEHARDKSEYVYVGRVDKAKDLEAEIQDLLIDANRVQKWTWKGLPKYKSVVYDVDDTNARGARWLKMRLKKAVDWDMFCKVLDGWKESKKAFNDNAKYASSSYQTLDGAVKIENLKESKDQLLKLAGSSVVHKCMLKSQM